MASPAWTRLGELLMRRRIELDPRYRNRRAFTADRAVEYRIVNDIELGRRENYEPGTIAALEAAYAVTPGSFGRVLEGGELEPQRTPLRIVPPLPGDVPRPRRQGLAFDAPVRRALRPYLAVIEDKVARAAISEARRRGIVLASLLGENLDDPSWVPDGTAVFPPPAAGRPDADAYERALWDDMRETGILPGVPHNRHELEDSLAFILWRRDQREREEPGDNAGDAAGLAGLPARRYTSLFSCAEITAACQNSGTRADAPELT